MMSVINLQKINAKLYNCDLNQTLFICLHTFVSALIPLIMPPSDRARLALWGVDRAKSAWSYLYLMPRLEHLQELLYL